MNTRVALYLLFIGLAVMAVLITADRSVALEQPEELIAAPPEGEPHPGFAVVELFTSEGCSSCPPAERLANRLVGEATKKRAPVYVLAFHVDYWDRLGWADRFADARYSQRQRDYAKAFKSRRIYTPQVIVNGRHEFVGSNGPRLKNELESALTTPPAISLRVAAEFEEERRSLKVDIASSDLESEALLHVAVVESNLTTEVERGENRGRTLNHHNVVRAFATRVVEAEPGTWSLTLSLPEGLVPKNAAVIAYLQRPEGGPVFAVSAARIPINEAKQ